MAGILYLCATPIGNLKDITLRVLETLQSADLVAAEDTRNTRKLLTHYNISAKLVSYHEHNKYEKAEELVARMLEGASVALVTDAGTPGISDPGEELVRQCRAAGVEVTALPGASAVVTALSVAGLSSRRFVFEGFLPTEKKERKEALLRIEKETRTIVLYEAPHRLAKTLEELLLCLGERQIRICRELTKIHEEVLAFSLSEAIRFYASTEPKGEIVLLIEGLDQAELKAAQQEAWNEMPLAQHIEFYLSKGLEEKEAMRLVAKDRGVSKRDIYNQWKR